MCFPKLHSSLSFEIFLLTLTPSCVLLVHSQIVVDKKYIIIKMLIHGIQIHYKVLLHVPKVRPSQTKDREPSKFNNETCSVCVQLKSLQMAPPKFTYWYSYANRFKHSTFPMDVISSQYVFMCVMLWPCFYFVNKVYVCTLHHISIMLLF